ncbi:MAG: aromatic-ring-hydroxylating dioxygenase subunit beta [Actinobacteria bacterium]|nr:aromatic-ring-hydroxylating dioxygenase subunit beta [Actinomycetota bacterium]
MSTIAAVDLATHYEVEQFLYHEAACLDDNRIREWFSLIADDIDYKCPIRITRERAAGAGFSDEGMHFDDDWGMLEVRVDRLETEYAWAEDPPSRTRRLVSNVRVQATERPDEWSVRSNLILYRNRYDYTSHQIIAGERHDVVRRTPEGFRLAKRWIYLDQATLATHNLGIFL